MAPPGAHSKVRTPTSPRQQPISRKRQRKADPRRTPRGGGLHSSRVDPSVAHLLEEARHKKTAVKNIEAVIFSQWRLEPWYWAPFPEQYHHQSLYFCDWTLRYTTSQILAVEHRTTTISVYGRSMEKVNRGTARTSVCSRSYF